MKKGITFLILCKEVLQQQVGFQYECLRAKIYRHCSYLGTQNLYVRQDAGYEGTDNYEAINPGDLAFEFLCYSIYI